MIQTRERYKKNHVDRQAPAQDDQRHPPVAAAASAGVAGNVLAAEIHPDHAADILETDKHEMEVATQKDYRRRQKEIIGWMKEKYPEQYNHCVVELSPEQIADPKLRYFTFTHEFMYENINFDIIKAFMSSEKKFKDSTRTKQCSEVHIHKYHDAIKFGSKTIAAPLPCMGSQTVEAVDGCSRGASRAANEMDCAWVVRPWRQWMDIAEVQTGQRTRWIVCRSTGL